MRKTLPPPSLMVRKFMNHSASGHESTQSMTAPLNPSQEGSAPADPFERQYCFFYGTLMDPETLSQVLRTSDSLPIMSRARVIGYDIKLWVPYPDLIDGKPLQLVDDMVFEILSKTQLDRLVSYETDKYQFQPCLIDILNHDNSVISTVDGVTFMWNGQQGELQEGKFDLKQWKKEKRLRNLDSLSN
ncbi:hypothetical protein N7462_000424 [Penicillium macrosclerotiorum]|uniref:uncharacterized protein n=1 Tax=Penicillium macrosclerotiorum TaxID=303699 RepID=UPI00254896E6|nr:uncharacterized protein N7462_000424 [Penicillium macrosclerotiorum]KAJ5698419.1 hypothetical protein N7462_000424 [Penicillium macrosclerotiorum]